MTWPFCVKCHVGVHFDMLVRSIKTEHMKKINYTQVAPVMYGDRKWIQLL
jgi:hypothetical protein